MSQVVPKQHVVTALVQNEAGTINRLVSLFRRRGFSLASFNAGDCEDEGFSRITLLVNGSDEEVAQCLKQLDKLIDVVECEDLAPDQTVSRELAFVRIDPPSERTAEARKVAEEFLGKIVRESDKTIIVEIAEQPHQIEELLTALKPFNVTEVVRTGLVAIKMGDD